MNAGIDAFVEKIIADAETKIKTDLEVVSQKIRKDFTDKAKEAVLQYYANYTPEIYVRTNNLRDNVVRDISFSVLNSGQYGAFIQFNSSKMSEYPSYGRADGVSVKDIVVANFMAGIHGREEIQKDDNPAQQIMDGFQINYKKTLDRYFVNLGYKVRG